MSSEGTKKYDVISCSERAYKGNGLAILHTDPVTLCKFGFEKADLI
jgi:hypothetical protein